MARPVRRLVSERGVVAFSIAEGLEGRELDAIRRRAAEEAVNKMTAALLDIDVNAFAAPAAGLGGLRGKTVEEVAATLLGLVEPSQLEQEVVAGGDAPVGAEVEKMARELLGLIGPASLESNS